MEKRQRQHGLFLQTLLGYTAYHSGLAITPRGIGCLVTILLAGYLSNKVDDRIVIAFGFILLAVSSFMFGDLTLGISMDNIIWPNVLSGMALGFIFGSLFLTYGLVKPNILIMLFAVILLLSAVGCILHVETKIRRMFGDGNTAAHAGLL